MNLKKRVEAIVFSAGKYVSVEEIAKLCRADINSVTEVLNELKKDYDDRDSSLSLMNEGNNWKLTVKEIYIPTVRKIVAETELTKAVMQTLSYIAYKAPILQSDVVSARSNKAYEHIAELESKGFLTKTKRSHTFLINLTQKFFEYFDLKSKEDVQKRFGNVKELSSDDVMLRDVERKWDKEEKATAQSGMAEEEAREKEKTQEAAEEAAEKEELKEFKEPEEAEKKKLIQQITAAEHSEEEIESQIDELRKKEKQKAMKKEIKKIEKHFTKIEKEENKNDNDKSNNNKDNNNNDDNNKTRTKTKTLK